MVGLRAAINSVAGAHDRATETVGDQRGFHSLGSLVPHDDLDNLKEAPSLHFLAACIGCRGI